MTWLTSTQKVEWENALYNLKHLYFKLFPLFRSNLKCILTIEYQVHSGIIRHPLFYATQIINPFLIQESRPIMIKWRDIQPIVKSLSKGLKLYWKISFIWTNSSLWQILLTIYTLYHICLWVLVTMNFILVRERLNGSISRYCFNSKD